MSLTSSDERDLDRVLENLNVLIKRTQWLAREARQDSKHILLLKAIVAVLDELSQLACRFFESKGKNIMEVRELILRQECLIDKLALKLPSTEDTNDAELNEENNRVLVQKHGSSSVLSSIIMKIRYFEKSFEFQQNLWQDKENASLSLTCSTDQFSYGTSSFSLFSNLFQHKSFQKRMKSVEPRVVIFGSSIGLLSFYVALTFPKCKCFGYEVLPSLHEKAIFLKSEYDIKNVEFYLKDMIKADVSQADIVILASLCWDRQTKIAVSNKLTEELKHSSLVVDYSSDSFDNAPAAADVRNLNSELAMMIKCLDKALERYLDKYFPHLTDYALILGCTNSTPKSRILLFCLEGIVEGHTSWAVDQNLYLYGGSTGL
jgi:hypothetical protein